MHLEPRSIIIAGASGYIGRALIPALREKYPDTRITALSRTPRESQDPLVHWRACDLFSLKDIEQALPPDVDVAYYLVHSMNPTAHLDQGSFADYDLILADNFARAMKARKPVHVIYLGGLIPQDHELSRHLQSRLEVEQVFKDRELQHTSFRAGLIIGPHGSSFEIMLRLVKRLPVMLCPLWTQTLTTPVDLATVIHALANVAGDETTFSNTYDLAGCQPLTYIDMMKETAEWFGLHRVFIKFPLLSTFLSRWWVYLITQIPRELIYPLVESLRHSMIARPQKIYGPKPTRTYAEMLREMPRPEREKSRPAGYVPERLIVRSVQRLPRPPQMTAADVKEEYVRWLPRFMWPFLIVWVDGERIVFSFLNKRWRLLALSLSSQRSSPDRQLLYIIGGYLAGTSVRGRLEFREVLQRKYVLAAIHEYRPALPWYIYQNTQARVHLWVMKAFYWHLRRLKRANKSLRTQATR